MHIRRPPVAFHVGFAAVLAGLVAAFITAQAFLFTLGVVSLLAGSVIGAAVVSMICPQKSTGIALAYIVPGTIAYVLLPIAVAAMSDGHPGHVMYWEFLTLAHIALSLITLHVVRSIPNPRIRLAVPAVALAIAGLTSYSLSVAGKRYAANLLKQTQDGVGAAFERDILPHCVAIPGHIVWTPATQAGEQYSISGQLPPHGSVRLSGRDPYNIWFEVTLDAGPFEPGDQKDLTGRMKRAKAWLKECGAAKEVIDGLANVYERERWEVSYDGSHTSYVAPGKGKVTLGGLASFDPGKQAFVW